MKSTYDKKDVVILLKDITGLVKPQSTQERERLIQSGIHYCQMLPIEYKPSEKYMQAYTAALHDYAQITANAVGCLSDKIINKRGNNIILVSLARAGIPIGILVKRYIKFKYNIDVPHYSISIIRGKGIDKNAINYLLKQYNAEDILFLDGWIGKGAILKELKSAVKEFEGISAELAVLSDPANITELCGTHDDILIPSSCLNSTVSGLISRTFLRDDIISQNDFHGAVYYSDLEKEDLSYEFINTIEYCFKFNNNNTDNYEKQNHKKGTDIVKQICDDFDIKDINLVKPGIGETTRVLLRRVPWKILINKDHKYDLTLNHIIKLAEEKNVEIEYYSMSNYKACGIIKNMTDV